jgi:hypothetical protein
MWRKAFLRYGASSALPSGTPINTVVHFLVYPSGSAANTCRTVSGSPKVDQRAHLRRNIRFYVTLFLTISCVAMKKQAKGTDMSLTLAQPTRKPV